MKKIIAIFLLAAFLLAGCSPVGEDGKKSTEQTAENTQSTEKMSAGQQIQTNETIGFVISFRGTDIVLGTSMEPVLAELGDPTGYTEETSCAFEGLDKTYYYGSLYIQTNPSEQGDVIAAVWFADDTIATAEGIYIGASQSAVEAMYGAVSDNCCIVDRDGQRLMVLLTDGTVSSIQYTLVQA